MPNLIEVVQGPTPIVEVVQDTASVVEVFQGIPGSSGRILTSPNNTRYRLKVDDTGTLFTEAV